LALSTSAQTPTKSWPCWRAWPWLGVALAGTALDDIALAGIALAGSALAL
jgi:hypothetical protein